MPYKDPEKKREHDKRYFKQYYEENKVKILERQREVKRDYLNTENGKQVKLASTQRMKEKYPEKWKARYTLRNAVRLGHIIKGVCEVCGSSDVESHHDDYSKPLKVRWLCHQHHCELEGRWIPRTTN